jgi:putative two-component system response regulator
MNPSDEAERSLILVVDDTPDNLTLMSELLEDLYRVKVASSGERALKICAATPPDLILLDIMMPDLDGYEVSRRLKSDPRTRHIPIIFLTARSSVEDEQKGFEGGAVDYIVKPISPPLVLARVKTHLTLKTAADFLRDKNEFLEREVEKRTAEITAIQNATIQVVTSLAETRDQETGNHIRRTQSYVRLIAMRLSKNERFRNVLTASAIATLYKSAPLHDIGKVGIPDRILLKPGKLTADEFRIMMSHTTIGHAAIERAEEQLGMEVDFLKTAKQIALSHHEKWDGSGYPHGLHGVEIPLGARLMAVADVYDALISKRVYKEPIPHAEAMRLILADRGSHFDPDVLDAFLAAEEDVLSIAERFRDMKQEQITALRHSDLPASMPRSTTH